MAHSFGVIQASLWDDEDDFVLLERGPQWLYEFLCTQENRNHAGVLPLTLTRWAGKAKNLTPDMLRADLAVLEKERYVVVDYRTEEVLIRSYIRRDNVWKAPRVMGSAVASAMQVASRRLRRVILAESFRIPLGELSDEPIERKNGSVGPSIRSQVEGHITTLRQAFAGLDPDPDFLPGAPFEEPLPEGVPEGVREGVREGVLEGDPQGLGMVSARVHAGPRTRAHAHVSPSPSPSPNYNNPSASGAHGADVPAVPGPDRAEEPRGGAEVELAAEKPKRRRKAAKPQDPAEAKRKETARSITRWWWDNLAIKPAGEKAWFAAVAVIDGLLKAGHDPNAVAAAAGDVGKPLTFGRMEIRLGQLSGTNVVNLRPTHQGFRNPDAGGYREAL